MAGLSLNCIFIYLYISASVYPVKRIPASLVFVPREFAFCRLHKGLFRREMSPLLHNGDWHNENVRKFRKAFFRPLLLQVYKRVESFLEVGGITPPFVESLPPCRSHG